MSAALALPIATHHTGARWMDMTPAEYHQANGPPRLSQSLAKELCERSPWHAKRALERGRKEPTEPGDDDASDAMDRGTILHALLLNTTTPAVIVADADRVPFKDFRTKAAKEQRDKVRAAGLIPVIAHKVESTVRLADRIRDQLFNEHGVDLSGQSERAIFWTEHAADGTPVQCRGMLDHWIHEEARGRYYTIYDLKIWASANPRILARKIHDMGLDIQAEAYTRAVEQVHPELAGRVRFVALVCEASSGLVTPVTLAGTMRQIGRMRWRRAIDLWARCSRLNDWPGYTRGEMVIDAPEYMLAAEISAAQESNDLAQYVGRGAPPTEPGFMSDDEGDDDATA